MARNDAAADRPEADVATVMVAMMGWVFSPSGRHRNYHQTMGINSTPFRRFNLSNRSP